MWSRHGTGPKWFTPNRRQSPKYPLERLDLYGIYTTVRKPWSSKENKQIQLRFVDSI
jgi:hypothetical protein